MHYDSCECSTHGSYEKWAQFRYENLKGETNIKLLALNGITLRWISKKWGEKDGELGHRRTARLVNTVIFEPKRDHVTGGWRKLHNEELHNLYSSPSIIRMIKSRKMIWVGHVARMGAKRNAYRTLVGKPEGKRPLGRPRRTLVDNIKMDLREKMGRHGLD
jgi:hypothetical protein